MSNQISISIELMDAYESLAATASGVGRILMDLSNAIPVLDESSRNAFEVLGTALDHAVFEAASLKGIATR